MEYLFESDMGILEVLATVVLLAHWFVLISEINWPFRSQPFVLLCSNWFLHSGKITSKVTTAVILFRNCFTQTCDVFM